MSKRRSLFVAISGAFAAVLGALWWRLGSRRSIPTPLASEAISTEITTPLVSEIDAPAASIPQWVVITLRLISTIFGLVCLTQMQFLLLASRLPFAPMGLFVLGVLLLLPMTANVEMVLTDVITEQQSENATVGAPNNRMRRGFYFAAALFFVFVSLFIAQFGKISLLLWLIWLLGIIAILAATLTIQVDWRALVQQPKLLQRVAPDVAIALLLPLVLGVMLRLTFAPQTPLPMQMTDFQIMDLLANSETPDYYAGTSPFYLTLENALAGPTRELPDLQRISGFFALALVPAIYLFARVMAGRWAGLFAAGFTAVGLWTLALAKSGSVYPALAMFSALFLSILFFEPPRLRENTEDINRARFVFAGLILGIGWLIAPEFGYLALLLPIRALLSFLDEHPAWWKQAIQRIVPLYRTRMIIRVFVILFTPLIVPLMIGYRWLRAQRHVPNSVAALMITAALVLPFARLSTAFQWLPIPNLSPDFQLLTGIPAPYAALDALSYGLLLFNLTRDPSPIHGIINRPVFMPLLGALFLMGLLGWVWRVYRMRRWREGFLLAAFLVTLLPSALNLPLPLMYPDAWRVAVALPIAVFMAAYGAMLIAQSLQTLLGRVGIGLAIVLFIVSLWFIGVDARNHINNVALPAYEQATSQLSEITP